MTWVLKRNCSASPKQLAIVLASLVAMVFTFGAAFAALGFWMILPFAGLELAAIAAAFVWIGRHATDVQRIELSGDRLVVESVEGALRRSWQFDVAHARVRLEERGQGNRADVRVLIASAGRVVEIGHHLVNGSRLRLARDLQAALADVQR